MKTSGQRRAAVLRGLGLHSLRAQLYAFLLLPLCLLALAGSLVAWNSAVELASAALDRLLLGSARMIGESVRVAGERARVEVPPAALENLHSAEHDLVFHRVDTPQGLIAGSTDLPLFPARLHAEAWRAFDASVRDMPVRVVAYAQPVYPFGPGDQALIQVATTEREHDALVRRMWWRAVWPQWLLLAAATLLGHLWIGAVLAPLARIGDAVRRRAPDSGEGIVVRDAPAELAPLVDAINAHIARMRDYLGERDRFIANAAHQLKTPITVLNTQVAVGLRADDPDTPRRALRASRDTLRHCARLIQQLLTLSSADHRIGTSMAPTATDLAELGRDVLVQMAEFADARGIDLGLALRGADLRVRGVEPLLRALVDNLVDNAIRYTPAGGSVTLTLDAVAAPGVLLEVADTGPGIPRHERERVFERFYRLQEHGDQPGSGLGLAIVREIARAGGATVSLHGRDDGRDGLVVRVVFPPQAAAG